MIEDHNEDTQKLKDNDEEQHEQKWKNVKLTCWPKKPYSAEAEVKKLRKQLQEKRARIREMSRKEKDVYRTIWKQDEEIEKLKGMLERDGRDTGDIIPG